MKGYCILGNSACTRQCSDGEKFFCGLFLSFLRHNLGCWRLNRIHGFFFPKEDDESGKGAKRNIHNSVDKTRFKTK